MHQQRLSNTSKHTGVSRCAVQTFLKSWRWWHGPHRVLISASSVPGIPWRDGSVWGSLHPQEISAQLLGTTYKLIRLMLDKMSACSCLCLRAWDMFGSHPAFWHANTGHTESPESVILCLFGYENDLGFNFFFFFTLLISQMNTPMLRVTIVQ